MKYQCPFFHSVKLPASTIQTRRHISAVFLTQNSLFSCQLHELLVFPRDVFICSPAVRNHAAATVLNSVFKVSKITPAFIAQRIQRAVAEQTVKIIFVLYIMAWEVFTFPMAEKLVFTHYFTSFGKLSSSLFSFAEAVPLPESTGSIIIGTSFSIFMF